MSFVKWNSLHFLSTFVRVSRRLLLKNLYSLKIMLICVENTFERRIKWHWDANITGLAQFTMARHHLATSEVQGPKNVVGRMATLWVISDTPRKALSGPIAACRRFTISWSMIHSVCLWTTSLGHTILFQELVVKFSRKKWRKIHSDKSGF